MIIIVFGLPGAGKSYFAQGLAARIGAEYVNSDRIRKKMFGNRTYSEKEKMSVYDEMLAGTRQAAESNKTLVLDATFYRDAIRREFIKVAGDDILFIEIKADEALIKERMKQKRADSEADFNIYKSMLAEFEPIKQPHLILNSTNGNLTEMINEAINYLKAANDKRTS
jgi:predicted kinase